MRELAILPKEARLVVEKGMKRIRRLLISNIKPEKTAMDASGLTDIAMTFFSEPSMNRTWPQIGSLNLNL
jgi:glycerol-3-phosphate dehydrogenase